MLLSSFCVAYKALEAGKVPSMAVTHMGRLLNSNSATIALGIGVVADISTSAERGMYMGYVTSVSTTFSVVAFKLTDSGIYDCTRRCPHHWRCPFPVPWMAVHFLVPCHHVGRLSGSAFGGFPRDRQECCGQWIDPSPRLEHVLAELPGSPKSEEERR